jgi:predicted amidophosphoribosyltransferase
MQTLFGNIFGQVSVVKTPDTHEELRAMLLEYGFEPFCPDCEATLDDTEAWLCPCCGEGIGAEPEYVKVRRK